MLTFISAHGFDPVPTQRPLSAGALTGLIAAVPAGALLYGFGTVSALAGPILRLGLWPTVLVLTAGFLLAGTIYGGLLRRAASDRRGGWAYGLVFGLLLWIAAPLIVLPLIGADRMAAGRAGQGFLLGFMLWGALLGVIFPFVHRWLEARIEASHPDHRHGSLDQAARPGLVRRWERAG